MQRLYVVALDEALAPVAVGLPEVKAARLARKRVAVRQYASDLFLTQRRLALPYSVQRSLSNSMRHQAT
jgi:hypothetical protein